MSLLFLNISIDTPDTYKLENNLASVNEQDSIIELVLEKGFMLEDVISEYDDNDSHNDSNLKKNTFVDAFLIPCDQVSLFESYYSRKEKPAPICQLILAAFLDIYSPPPEV